MWKLNDPEQLLLVNIEHKTLGLCVSALKHDFKIKTLFFKSNLVSLFWLFLIVAHQLRCMRLASFKCLCLTSDP